MTEEQTTFMYGLFEKEDTDGNITVKIGEGGVMNDLITIPRNEYKDLLSDSAFLNALIQSGVDNWDGFENAKEVYQNFKDNL